MELATENVTYRSGGMSERRGTIRFPLREDVRYKLIHGKVVTTGLGKTLNIGSGGVLFTTDQRLPMGRTVELSVDWPARLDGTCPLKFVATGRVIRSENAGPRYALSADQFRTRATR